MRTREQIEKEINKGDYDDLDTNLAWLSLEVLLDIRDLLTPKDN